MNNRRVKTGNKKMVQPLRKEYKITPEMLKELEILAGNGLNQRDIYEYYSIPRTRWFQLKNEFREMEEAMFRGKAKRIANAADKLQDLINAENFNAIKYFLDTKGRWAKEYQEDSDKEPKEHVVDLGTDPVEAARIYQQIMLDRD